MTPQHVVFFPVHPLAESDPAERTEARQQTSTLEVADFLADPDAAVKPPRKSFAEWLGQQPEWTGPPAEDDGSPRLDLFALAYAQYIRETWPERISR